MSDCPFNLRLDAFHDGELDAKTAGELEAHLPGCEICRAELADLGAIAGMFAPKQSGMLPLELARLHQQLDESTLNQPAESEFLRMAGMLSALAASILVISSVWLSEFPSRHTPGLSPGPGVVSAADLGNVPNWERTALTFEVEPQFLNQNPGGSIETPFNPTGLADSRTFGDNNVDAQVADWMVAGLNGGMGVGHANP
jgi:hypothetical protein